VAGGSLKFKPGEPAAGWDERVAAIRRDDYGADRLPGFVERHLAHLDGHATDRVIEQLILPGLLGPRT